MTTSFVFFDKWGHQEMVTGYLWGPFPNKFEGLGSNICSENPIKLFVFSRCFSPDWSGNTMDLRFPSDQPFQQACPVIPLGLWPSWSKPQETQKNHWCWWFGTWLLVSISYMGCHPSRWRTPSFFKMVIAPPTRDWYGLLNLHKIGLLRLASVTTLVMPIVLFVAYRPHELVPCTIRPTMWWPWVISWFSFTP